MAISNDFKPTSYIFQLFDPKLLASLGYSWSEWTQVIVAEFDVYTKTDPMASGEGAYIRHTSDGEDNVIFNGVPDWVYEGKLSSLNLTNQVP